MHSNRLLKIISVLLLICVLFLTVDSLRGAARASFSIDDENKLGREFYEKIEKAGALSKNERANAFISQLGKRILSHSDQTPFDFKFSIIRSSAINAFAPPGG
jgi:predicted Zn-dependent protease